jgi:DNA helicase II / ATP-dependent DNA helicase PcrA
MQFLNGLNDGQLAAVEAGEGPVLIVAGPGTGKTKTLTARIVYLIKSREVLAGKILALTFTKKAAEEMRQRVATQLNTAPQISTFHALCHDLLKEHTGAKIEFITEPQRVALIKSLQRPASLRHLSPREAGLLISKFKNDAEQTADAYKITQAYNQALTDQNLYDFDDLLAKTRDLLLSNAQVAKDIKMRFKYILVDEFQDTNQLQYQLLQLIRGNDNLFIIGDPNQSIYGFRGASGDIFAQFKRDFPQAKQVTLQVNYRSAPEIVRLSNTIFADSTPLKAYQKTSGGVRAVQVLNEYSEANWVLEQIQNAIGGGDFTKAVSDDSRAQHSTLKDFAILYRSRSAALAIIQIIEQSGLPYQIVGEGSPYEQPDVLAAITLLRILAEVQDPMAVKKLSANQVQKLLEKIDKNQPPSQIVDELSELFDLKQTRGLGNNLVRFKDLSLAVEYLDEISAQQFYDPQADAITLLTIHASKGLEFPQVFLIGANLGVLPHEKADITEEKRLFYVAATRAKQHLDILYSLKRGGEPEEASPFISEITDSILPKIDDPNLGDDQRRAHKRQLKRSQQSLF